MSELSPLLALLIATGALLLQFLQNKRERVQFLAEQRARAEQRAEREQAEAATIERRFRAVEDAVNSLKTSIETFSQITRMEKDSIERRLLDGDAKLQHIEAITRDIALMKKDGEYVRATLGRLTEQREAAIIEAIAKLVQHQK